MCFRSRGRTKPASTRIIPTCWKSRSMRPTALMPTVSASSSTNTAPSRRSAPRWRGSRRRRARAGRRRRHADQVFAIDAAQSHLPVRRSPLREPRVGKDEMSATNSQTDAGGAGTWPSLAFDDWKDTCETLQLWTQVVGKIRLKLAPMVNHWWQVTLYVTATGLTTSAMPYQGRLLQIDFDFLGHRLLLRTSDGAIDSFALAPCAVADFYAEVMARLRALGIDLHIWTMPSEIEGAVPFERDREHAAYDRDAAQRFWRQLVQVDRVD